MAINWKNLRVPAGIHRQLKKLAARFDECQTLGTMDVPAEFADRGGTPLWYVVEKALGEYLGHKARSRRKRAKNDVSKVGKGQGRPFKR